MRKRKHRLVVEITTSAPMTERKAAQGLRLVLSRLDWGGNPIWAYGTSPYIEKLTVKAFSRVVGRSAK